MRYIVLLIISVFLISLANAQEVKFSVTVDKDTVKMGQVIELSYTFENITGRFEPPPLADFELIGVPNHSTMMTLTLGRIHRTSTYTYNIRPKRSGQLIIESANLITEKETHQTDQIPIFVLSSADFFENNPKSVPQDKGNSPVKDKQKERPTFKL
jgi:hypothetical protein